MTDETGYRIYADDGRIVQGETALQCPREIQYSQAQYDGDDLVLLVTDKEPAREPDFELSSPAQNIVRVTDGPRLVWTSGERPESAPTAPFNRIHVFGDRAVAAKKGEFFAEIAPETGIVEEWWSATEFLIGDRVVQLPGVVSWVKFVEHTWVFQVEAETGDKTLLAVDTDGTQLWERETDTHWWPQPAPESFGFWDGVTRGTAQQFTIAPRTGEILDIESCPGGKSASSLDWE